MGEARRARRGRAHRLAPALELSALFHFTDELRRQRGRLLEGFGLGPVSTPSRVARRWPIGRLLAYQEPDERRPAILLVPAPIKTAYIWDLAPGASVVQLFRSAGLQVYLMQWHRPDSGDQWMGLADYADVALRGCVEVMRAETRRSRFFIAGHSLGGTLAAIFASLHPARVQGLIALEAPIEFGAGRLEAAVAVAPPAAALTAMLGNVPGTALDAMSLYADPLTFAGEPLADLVASSRSAAEHRLHWQVRRWTLDETPIAQRLYEEVQEELYRRNRFAQDGLRLGARLAHPAAIAAPIMAVADPRSRIIPKRSVEAFCRLTSSKDVEVLDYHGDAGVMIQHVGVLVGRNAHHGLWPQILAWSKRR